MKQKLLLLITASFFLTSCQTQCGNQGDIIHWPAFTSTTDNFSLFGKDYKLKSDLKIPVSEALENVAVLINKKDYDYWLDYYKNENMVLIQTNNEIRNDATEIDEDKKHFQLFVYTIKNSDSLGVIADKNMTQYETDFQFTYEKV